MEDPDDLLHGNGPSNPEVAPRGQRLLEAGDIPHLAALIAPRRLTIAGAVHGSGKTLTEAELKANFKFTRRFYMGDSFTAIPVGNAKAILRILK